MTILCGIVARGPTILAKHVICAGNFLEVAEQVLIKIGPEDGKLTYSHGRFLLHYISESRIIYMCITDDEFERSRAFGYLNEIKRKFQLTYGARALTAMPYAMNSDFSAVLSNEMRAYSGAVLSGHRADYGSMTEGGSSQQPAADRVSALQSQVEDLKTIMVRNIDSLSDRGEKLELLIDRTENLETGAVSFRTRSRNLARTMMWKNLKITAIVVIVVVVLILVIFVIFNK